MVDHLDEKLCGQLLLSVAGRPEVRPGCDAASYDRLRVLATELRRVLDDGGEVALRIGTHVLTGERLRAMMREVY